MEGFEFLEGIPGSVGGSLRMNAGAMGNWIFDVVESVYYLEETGKIRIRSKKDFHVHYRKCEELLSGIALGAIFRPISQNESEKIRQKMFEFSHQRKSSQPKEPSAGCIFKNPEGGHAGKIVDELGLKGTRIGNAEVSMTHGNFIINHGNAKSDDVLSLIKQIRNQIYEKRGVLLEPEVLLLGQEWSEVL
jgi:UDP-N-acetylenolpyruvoylglucosamine reductase